MSDDLTMVTVDEVIEAQGPKGNVIHIEHGPHALLEVSMDLIYEDDRAGDPLDGLHDATVAQALASKLIRGEESWRDIPPVILHPYTRKDGREVIWLGDGHHRFVAHLLAEQTHIMAFVPESLIKKVT